MRAAATFAALTLLAFVLTACGGGTEETAAPRVGPTVTTTVTAEPPDLTPDYEAYIRDARKLGAIGEAFARRGLINVADESCDALDDGATIDELVQAADDGLPNTAEYARALSTLAALRVCPEHASEVSALDAAPINDTVEDTLAQAEPTTPAPTKAPAPAAPPALPTTFGEGIYEAGRDIEPGQYRNAGAADPSLGPCLAFTSTKPNDYASISATSSVDGPGILQVDDGLYVSSTNCATWRR